MSSFLFKKITNLAVAIPNAHGKQSGESLLDQSEDSRIHEQIQSVGVRVSCYPTRFTFLHCLISLAFKIAMS